MYKLCITLFYMCIYFCCSSINFVATLICIWMCFRKANKLYKLYQLKTSQINRNIELRLKSSSIENNWMFTVLIFFFLQSNTILNINIETGEVSRLDLATAFEAITGKISRTLRESQVTFHFVYYVLFFKTFIQFNFNSINCIQLKSDWERTWNDVFRWVPTLLAGLCHVAENRSHGTCEPVWLST